MVFVFTGVFVPGEAWPSARASPPLLSPLGPVRTASSADEVSVLTFKSLLGNKYYRRMLSHHAYVFLVPGERLELSSLAAVGFESTTFTISSSRLDVHTTISCCGFHLRDMMTSS